MPVVSTYTSWVVVKCIPRQIQGVRDPVVPFAPHAWVYVHPIGLIQKQSNEPVFG